MIKSKTVSSIVQAGPEKTVATLMIPTRHWALFRRKIISENAQGYIEYLLMRYQDAQNIKFARLAKFAAHYQGRGLELRKFNFSICPVAWHRFRCLARYYGVSMCWLFVAMLLDSEKIGTLKNLRNSFMVKLYEKLKISCRMALRIYKVTTCPEKPPDTS